MHLIQIWPDNVSLEIKVKIMLGVANIAVAVLRAKVDFSCMRCDR